MQIAHGVRYDLHMQAISMSRPVLRQRKKKNGNRDSASRAGMSLEISCMLLCVCCCMQCCTNDVVSVHLVTILHSCAPVSFISGRLCFPTSLDSTDQNAHHSTDIAVYWEGS